jgi:formylglycine-generating enzyme required for sulfatase activity
MKKLLTAFFIMIAVTLLMANHAPRVEDISFSQRDDGSHMVDIYFNLIDQDGDLLTVTISASNNAGQSWNFPMSTYSGDFGENIIPGSNKHIIWDFAVDHPGVWEPDMRFKITVSDGHYDPDDEFHWSTVPAGTFTYGENDEIQTIDYDYEIMVYEVTNLQYLNYLEEALIAGEIEVSTTSVTGFYAGDENYAAGDYEFYDLDGSGCINWTGNSYMVVSGYEQHPVMEVSWFGANAFAEHYGWRLPTEYEWEKAARGMTGYEYPWGDNLSGDRANYSGSGDPWENATTKTTPVGFYNGQFYEGFQTTDSPSPYGCYDMCGNVYDWTSSWYGGSYYDRRVLRGGSWYSGYSVDYLRSWYRHYNYPTNTINNYGFRCARTLP